MKYKKILITSAFLLPAISYGAYGIGWNATSTGAAVITPNPLNGNIQAIQVPYIIGTSTATSTFNGPIMAPCFATSIAGGCITGGGGSFWTNTGLDTLLTTGLFADVPANGGYNIGGQLLAYASSTNKDTIFGIGAGGQNATTSATAGDNSLFGYLVGNNITTGFNNTAIGDRALVVNTTGSRNTAIGRGALDFNTTGSQNTSVGEFSLAQNTTGSENTSVGEISLAQNTTGSQNTALSEALDNNTIGNYNTAVGYLALQNVVTTSSSTALGANAGKLSTGSGNLFIGMNAASSTTSGSNNIALGYNIGFASITGSNLLDIGNLIFGTGIDGQGTTLSSGNIGIATITPATTLDVNGDITDEGVKSATIIGTDGTGKIISVATSSLGIVGSQWISNGNDIYYKQGFVGIGSSTPSAPLSVMGSSTQPETSPIFVIASSSVSNTATTTLFSVLGNGNVSIPNGNVGVATNAPLSKLDVNGGVAIGSYAATNAAPSNGLIVSGNVGIGTVSPGFPLEIKNIAGATDANPPPVTLALRSDYTSGTSRHGIGFYVNLNTKLGSGIFSPPGQLAFYTSSNYSTTDATEKMRIDTAGNVGIGETAPKYPLSVLGRIEALSGQIYLNTYDYAGGGSIPSYPASYSNQCF